VAVDGTKLKASASRHKAMTYARMKTTEQALAAQVNAWPHGPPGWCGRGLSISIMVLAKLSFLTGTLR